MLANATGSGTRGCESTDERLAARRNDHLRQRAEATDGLERFQTPRKKLNRSFSSSLIRECSPFSYTNDWKLREGGAYAIDDIQRGGASEGNA